MAIPLPAGVPVFHVEGHGAADDDQYAHVRYPVGISRSRRVSTAAEKIYSIRWLLEPAQLLAVVDWHENTLKAGSLTFSAQVKSQTSSGLEELVFRWLSFSIQMMHKGRGMVTGSVMVVAEPFTAFWDSAYLQGPGVLSNGDATISETIDDEQTWTRSVASISAGQKVWWRVILSSTGDTDHCDQFHGIRGTSEALTTNLVAGSTCVMRTQGNAAGVPWIAYVGSTGATINPDAWGNSQTDSDSIELILAFDNVNGKLFIGRGSISDWIGTGSDPSTGVNALISNIPSGTYHAFCGIDNDDGDNTATLSITGLPSWASASLAGYTPLGS